jgi:hypothetical protein
LIEEADYFGLDDLITIICRSVKGFVWFNISGKRIPIDSKLFDTHFGRMCRRDKISEIPRDDCGAYTFDRDIDMFSTVRNFLITNTYPRWINYK